MMSTEVISVGPDTPVEAIAALLVEHRISAVPVIEADGRLLGMVSQSDLLRLLESETEGGGKRSWWLSLVGSGEEQAHEQLKWHGRVAREVMTSPVVTVEPSTSIAELARRLETQGIKRVPVIADGRVVGIVSRGDLLRVFTLPRTTTPATADDRGLCRQVETKFSQAGLDWRHYVNIMVTDGTVHLWGLAASADEAVLFKRLAEEVAGEGRVESHLTLRDADIHLRPGGRFGLS